MTHLVGECESTLLSCVEPFVCRWPLATAVLLLASACAAFSDERADLQRLQMRATTEGYSEAALEVLLTEIDKIARELQLPERLPIKRSDLLETQISTPFWADHARQFGFVSTSNYYYYASVANKLSSIVPNFGTDDIRRPAYMESLRRRYLAPKAQMDTNAAYSMATQWLEKAGMDVGAIAQDAQRVDTTAWDIGNKFVPIYLVRWQKLAVYRGDNSPPKFQSIASIQFLVPERRILQMDINQEKYIKRNPLRVPDRDRLLQNTNDPKLRALWFTTDGYKTAALKAMLKEVNWIAQALRLPEKFPIESSDLSDAIIGTPYTADHQGCFAKVGTEKYSYWAGQKLTAVGRFYRLGEEEYYLASIRRRYTMPNSQINNGAAYTLATQWLAAVSVDLKRLEADYPSRITLAWDLGNQFVPLYRVEWVKPMMGSRRKKAGAKKEEREPERSLVQLMIERPEYMKREPLVVPDREKLLQAAHTK